MHRRRETLPGCCESSHAGAGHRLLPGRAGRNSREAKEMTCVVCEKSKLYVSYYENNNGVLCYCAFSCASTHTLCYATVRSLALPHVMLRYCAFCCASTHHARLLRVLLRFLTCLCVLLHFHVSCYATVRSLALAHVMLRYCAFSCASTCHATLRRGFLHFHISCYATARSFALPHMRCARSGFGAAISDTVVHSSIVFCNSVSADRIGMAALR